ncbi:MAG TPA: hypothetical protein VMK12_21310 [Anaeromyxobacteraceae bacterium]|nr:hypothetical protein [Anaeromyxobacteraceae bacterium]
MMVVVDDVNSLVAKFEPLPDEWKQHSVLLVGVVEDGTYVSRLSEL